MMASTRIGEQNKLTGHTICNKIKTGDIQIIKFTRRLGLVLL